MTLAFKNPKGDSNSAFLRGRGEKRAAGPGDVTVDFRGIAARHGIEFI